MAKKSFASRAWIAWFAVGACVAGGCSGSNGTGTIGDDGGSPDATAADDSGADASGGADTGSGGGGDSGSDAGDSGASSGADAGDDGGAPEGGGEGGTDAATDAATDGAADAATGCVIGGTPYASGVANPSDSCQSCQPTTSTTGWTNVSDGSSCSQGSCCSGVCADTQTDVSNCGGCGQVCVTANATPGCSNSQCTIAVCTQGFGNCNVTPVDGCEINFTNDVSNCGSCGNVCVTANGTPACSNGKCAILACYPDYADCDGHAIDGCEVNTTTDPNNCGGCGVQCNLPNATASCTGGSCKIAACNTGYADCNGIANDGCETNTTNNVSNCGMCGHQCVVLNGTPGCGNSQCTVAACNTGYADCDGFANDGCEANITNSVFDCGACGHQCQSGFVCSAGTCVP